MCDLPSLEETRRCLIGPEEGVIGLIGDEISGEEADDERIGVSSSSSKEYRERKGWK